MGALAASAVSLYPTVANGGLDSAEWRSEGNGNNRLLVRQLKLVLTGQGGLTNTIGASALGFSKLVSADVLWDATNGKGYPAVVDPVNNILVLLDGAVAPAPVDVTTTTAYIVVRGVPKLKATD